MIPFNAVNVYVRRCTGKKGGIGPMPDVLKNISTHDRFDMENRRVFKERIHKYWRVPMYTSTEA